MNWHSIDFDQAALFAFKTPFSIWYWCLHAPSWSVSTKGRTVSLSHCDVIAKGFSPSPITSISVLFPAYETVQRWKQIQNHPVKTLKWLPTTSMMYLHLMSPISLNWITNWLFLRNKDLEVYALCVVHAYS